MVETLMIGEGTATIDGEPPFPVAYRVAFDRPTGTYGHAGQMAALSADVIERLYRANRFVLTLADGTRLRVRIQAWSMTGPEAELRVYGPAPT